MSTSMRLDAGTLPHAASPPSSGGVGVHGKATSGCSAVQGRWKAVGTVVGQRHERPRCRSGACVIASSAPAPPHPQRHRRLAGAHGIHHAQRQVARHHGRLRRHFNHIAAAGGARSEGNAGPRDVPSGAIVACHLQSRGGKAGKEPAVGWAALSWSRARSWHVAVGAIRDPNSGALALGSEPRLKGAHTQPPARRGCTGARKWCLSRWPQAARRL